MMGGRTNEQWVAQYAGSHRNPINRLCHTLGIPLIAISLLIFAAAIFYRPLWRVALALFVLGWIFQFVGHAFEGSWPEFFHDYRFLFVGLRWWLMKMRGKA
jgi:uncharacterized membrane protein YGL010W